MLPGSYQNEVAPAADRTLGERMSFVISVVCYVESWDCHVMISTFKSSSKLLSRVMNSLLLSV